MSFGMTRLRLLLLRSDARVTAAVGLLGFALAMLSTLPRGLNPPPHVHDEFSYLLAADTFASGRLTNPPHPMWEFLETFHVLQQPTYASKYPPAQGLFLALGQVVTGLPITGVWLSYGLMCAALAWMLLAWTNRRWALFGGATAALFLLGAHVDTGNWGASYWGGAVAALGGALLLGAVRRLTMRPSMWLSVVMALGVGILANSRPYEGALLCLPVIVYLLVWLVRGPHNTLTWRVLTLAPAAIVLGVVGAGMAHYNARVTGSPWQMPYMVYESTYASRPLVMFGPHKQLQYRNREMERYYKSQPHLPRTPKQVAVRMGKHLLMYQQYYVPTFMLVLVFLAIAVSRDRSMWLPIAVIVTVTSGLVVATYSKGHYAAPLVGALLLVSVAAARRLWVMKVGRDRLGRQMVGIVVGGTLLSALAYPMYRLLPRHHNRWFEQRERISKSLESDGGRHLVIVQYRPSHDLGIEWVYNRADIDKAPIIWARSLGARDSTLVQYFGDRQIWTIDADGDDHIRLVPIGGAEPNGSR